MNQIKHPSGITLNENEKILNESSNKQLVVTNSRIFLSSGSFGSYEYKHLSLEDITSIEFKHTINYLFLIAGILLLLMGYGVYKQNSEYNTVYASTVAMFLGAVLVIIFFASKKSIMVIASPTSKLILSTTGMKKDDALEFMGFIEDVKTNKIYNKRAISYDS